MSANYLKKGSYNCICDRCGFKYKADETRMEWNGLRTCIKHCWEPRNPLDFQPPLYDNQKVPQPRPEGTDTFKGAAELTSDDLYL